MQRAFDFLLPELDKLEQFWVIRRQIVVLPNERIQHALEVGHPVEQFGRRETVAPEHQLGFRHLSHGTPPFWPIFTIQKPLAEGQRFLSHPRLVAVSFE